MSDLRQFIINQIHESYDPVPGHWRASDAKNWDDGTNAIADAILAKVRATLREHWLTSVGCDHAAGTDTPSCSCSLWKGPTVNSVGAAVDAWIGHVIEQSSANPL